MDIINILIIISIFKKGNFFITLRLNFKDIDVVITDIKPPNEYIKYFKKIGIELVY